jgi:hypothetical protein
LSDEGDWLVRVVANRTRRFDEFNCAISGVGYHEAVVASRLHNSCP